MKKKLRCSEIPHINSAVGSEMASEHAARLVVVLCKTSGIDPDIEIRSPLGYACSWNTDDPIGAAVEYKRIALDKSPRHGFVEDVDEVMLDEILASTDTYPEE